MIARRDSFGARPMSAGTLGGGRSQVADGLSNRLPTNIRADFGGPKGI